MTGSELPAEFDAMLRRIAAEDAPELLQQARNRALARAGKLLEDGLVRELLREAAVGGPRRNAADDRPSVRPPEDAAGAEALWAYCVLPADSAADFARGLEGVEPGREVTVVAEGPVAALVSAVPLSEYGDQRLREHLEDLDWLERVARAHETLQAQALERATIVPLRLCTLYRDPAGVRRFLAENADSLVDALARLDGCAEWGMKLFADPRRLQVARRGTEARSGAAYLAERRRERTLAEEASELRAQGAEAIHARLSAFAREATVNPPQRPELHGREETMVLNGAYLVERERAAELGRLVRQLQDEWEPRGFVAELTGPWPAYNFSGPTGVIA